MNILEAEDMVKGLPDQVLFQYAQNPPPQIPQYLAVSEVQRRQDMRQRFQAQSQGQQPTVKDQILQGIGATGMAPPISSAPPMAPPVPPMPQGAPLMAPPMPQGGPPMGGMFRGGATRMANGGITPGGIVYMQTGRAVPSDPGAVMFANMMGRVPEAFSAIRRLMPAPPGVSMADLEKFRPTREQYFDPEAERRRAELLARLEQMGTSRKAEDIAAAERYLKEAETPIQAAQDEARQAAIASTLMRLGAGVAAGKPEEGLAAAAQGVEQTMGRAREVAAAERRAARQDYRTAEREAVRAQRAAADQAFMMQAQNVTNDENRQRDLVRDQMQFAQWAFGLELEGGKNRQQAYNNALQLSIGLSQAIDERLQAAVREDRLDKRNYETIFSSTLKEVIAKSSEIDWGKDPETGDPIEPSLEQVASESAKIVDSILAKRGITNPSVSTTVTHNGQTFKFPTKEDADKFRAAVGAK